jgi:RimJ/RimL family protein N-acetyltransferase
MMPDMTWPPHDLVLRTPSLELRGMTEAFASRLALVVPDDLEHHPELAHVSAGDDVLQAYWRNAGLWRPTDWVLELVVLRDSQPIGLQALEGKDFASRRVVDTHSWLASSVRGLGLGKQMRTAVLALAFGSLGARCAITEAWSDNAASLGVSRSLGYVDNGVDVHAGGRVMQRLRLPVESWLPGHDVEVSGLEPCLPLLGLS